MWIFYVEEALYISYEVNKNWKNLLTGEYKDFIHNINYLENIFYRDDFKFKNYEEVSKEFKKDKKYIKDLFSFYI